VKHSGRKVIAGIVFFLFCPILAAPSYAYLDPGTGSYMLQLLIGILVGAAFAIRLYWKRIWSFLHERFSRRKNEKRTD
jgi:membrane protease YdiL (CAAX protease family)